MTTTETRVAPTDTGAEERGDRWISFALMALALIYALLAGLRTVADFDLGWQLATGRWIVQHHSIPSTEVFSYTAAGQPWIYPAGSALFFYVSYLLGGYALLSWIGSLACAGTAALLGRRGSLVAIVLIVFAVPLMAQRTAPRADMFTVILFAAFLQILWQYHKNTRAPLWLLPLLMMFWVNLHLGFIAGLVLLPAYVMLEFLDTIVRAEDRTGAITRLRRCIPWLLATPFATLLNPWGWKIYQAIFRQESAMAQHSQSIMEWSSVRLNWSSFLGLLDPRDPRGALDWMLLFAAAAVALALWRKRFGSAALLAGSALLVLQHIRFEALFAVVVVVVGGSVISDALEQHHPILDWRTRSLLRYAAALSLVAVCVIRSVDLVSNRGYIRSSDIASFGTGLSWWFPQGAADFIERTNPPGELFNGYNEGGYVLWRLGAKYRDYIDGRAIPFGSELFNRSGKLLSSAPESSEWQQEAERYHINSIIIPLGRYVGVRAFPVFRQFCNSEVWVPVHLDETSGVFVRRTAETEQFIERYRISCATVPLPAKSPERNDNAAYNQWANAAAVLHELGRDTEALAASDKAAVIDAESGYLYFLRGEILATMGIPGAEAAYLRATELQPNEVDWSSLAQLYQRERRFGAAMHAWEKAAEVSDAPARARLSLGYATLDAKKPKEALRTFDQAQAEFSTESASDHSFSANLAHGRALAWAALGDLKRAISYEEETVRLAPDRAEDWLQLSNLYLHDGRLEEAQRARQRAAEMNPRFQP